MASQLGQDTWELRKYFIPMVSLYCDGDDDDDDDGNDDDGNDDAIASDPWALPG